jgi:uncharacterized protein (TIGR03435 family)
MDFRRCAVVMAAAALLCHAQSFDVASVKLSSAPADGHGMSGPTPGGFTGSNAPLRQYVSFAYDMRSDLIFGPDWIGAERFDIVSRKEGPIPIGSMRVMLRNLLEERFHLVAHRETREVPVYALTVGKDGTKHLDKAAAGGAESVRPLYPGPGKRRFEFRSVTMSYLAFFLGKLGPLDRASVDLTGIDGRFDFDLDIPDRDADTASADYPISLVFRAIYTQLGLRVEARKAPVEVLVVDSALRVPTAN